MRLWARRRSWLLVAHPIQLLQERREVVPLPVEATCRDSNAWTYEHCFLISSHCLDETQWLSQRYQGNLPYWWLGHVERSGGRSPDGLGPAQNYLYHTVYQLEIQRSVNPILAQHNSDYLGLGLRIFYPFSDFTHMSSYNIWKVTSFWDTPTSTEHSDDSDPLVSAWLISAQVFTGLEHLSQTFCLERQATQKYSFVLIQA